ncbi:MAG: protein translocase subunit SecF [Negativicutes bacterium]
MIKFDLVHKRIIWFVFSLLILIPGLVSIGFRGFNLGIDFTGGSLLDLKFKQPVTVEQVRTFLNSENIQNPVIQMVGSEESDKGQEVLIRTRALDVAEERALLDKAKTAIGDYDMLRAEKVGAIIGSELTRNAILAVLISAALMIVYITIRFEFTFAISGIIALFHDVFIVLGLFSIFGWEIDATFVAAILTILGYSINDTIVIFDRIRENLKKMKKGEDLPTLVNISLWQTMRRSIYTVSTVMFCTASLYFFGGESTKNFSLALLIGFFCGTYSSIFNASQIWLSLKTRSFTK